MGAYIIVFIFTPVCSNCSCFHGPTVSLKKDFGNEEEFKKESGWWDPYPHVSALLVEFKSKFQTYFEKIIQHLKLSRFLAIENRSHNKSPISL